MNTRLRSLIFLFTILLSTMAYGQKKRVIEFDEDSSDTGSEEYIYKSSAIKFAPFNFIAGNLPFYFEKEISNVGIQIGLGPTFKRYLDLYSESFDDGEFTTTGDLTEDSFFGSGSFDIDDTKAKLGYVTSLETKYYYSEDGFEGGYFGVRGAFYKYNLESNIDTYTENYETSGSDTYKTLSFIYGHQYVQDVAIYDVFIGLGLAWVNRERFATSQQFGTGLQTGTVIYTGNPLKFEVGFRVGFQLN